MGHNLENWFTRRNMGHSWKNGLLVKIGSLEQNMSLLEKWVTLGKMGHSWKNGSHLEKMGHTQENGSVGKMDHT